MADDDYNDEDLTELAIDRVLSGPDDSSTDPMRQVAPAAVRAVKRLDDTDDETMVRSVLQEAALLDLQDIDATVEGDVYGDEDATNLHIALDRSALNPRPSSPAKLPSPRRPAPPGDGRPGPPPSKLVPRPKTTSGLVPRPKRPPEAWPRAEATEPAVDLGAAERPSGVNPVPPPHLRDPDVPVLETPEDRPDTNEQLRRLGLTRRKEANANHVRGHSGFYSLPEANVDATAEHKALDARHRDALGLSVALFAGVLTGAGMLAAAVSRWMDPTRMMAVTLLVMVISCGIVAALVVPRGQKLRLSGLRRAYLPMSYAAALPLIAALAWQLGFFRSAVRGFAPGTPEMAQKVLEDRSDHVALAECVSIAPRYEYGVWRTPLVSTLAGRPGLSAACLDGLDPDVSRAFGATLADRWHRELLAGDLDGDRACDIAESLAGLEQPPGEVETRLLTCLLDTPNAETRGCCAGALAKIAQRSPAWTDDVRNQEGYVASETTAEGFLALAFHPDSASPEDVESFKAARLNGPEGQVLALAVACDTLRGGGTDLGRRLAVSADSSCEINLATLSTSREVWLEVCEETEARLEQGGELPAKVLCEVTQSSLTRLAVSDASRIVGSAAKNRIDERKLAFAIDVEGETKREPKYKSKMRDKMKRFRDVRKEAAAAKKSTFGRGW